MFCFVLFCPVVFSMLSIVVVFSFYVLNVVWRGPLTFGQRVFYDVAKSNQIKSNTRPVALATAWVASTLSWQLATCKHSSVLLVPNDIGSQTIRVRKRRRWRIIYGLFAGCNLTNRVWSELLRGSASSKHLQVPNENCTDVKFTSADPFPPTLPKSILLIPSSTPGAPIALIVHTLQPFR